MSKAKDVEKADFFNAAFTRSPIGSVVFFAVVERDKNVKNV
jgi:hypothetical protein